MSGANAPRRLMSRGATRYPIWSADGERVAFQSDREGDQAIFWQRADGTGTAERLTKPEKGVSHIPDSWSPDGQHFSFTAAEGNFASVWTFSLQDRKATPFTQSSSSSSQRSVFSPDGRWVAYQSNETGLYEVYVRPFPATATQYQVSKGGLGGGQPSWSRNGKELIFDTGPALSEFRGTPDSTSFSVVSVTTEPSFNFGHPTLLRGSLMGSSSGVKTYDVLPDGRLIGVAPPTQTQAGVNPQIHVVLNWFEDLKQRVPVGNK
jgi:serine/threonine-protein kinase